MGGTLLECPDWVTGEAMPLDATGHQLYKATLLIPEDIASLPNRNKHKEAAKVMRQRNRSQIK